MSEHAVIPNFDNDVSLTLKEPVLLEKPADVPPGYIAYNPSAIWSVRNGDMAEVMYVRVEPDRSDPNSSHLGKTKAVPYQIEWDDKIPQLKPYEHAPVIAGEDPALTRVSRKLSSGKLQRLWLLSVVNARPKPDKPNEVLDLRTEFYAGDKLDSLEHVASGPKGMKDIRVAQAPDGAGIVVYGRPQPELFSGNISYAELGSLDELNESAIEDAGIIDEKLLPFGSGRWGGVNDVAYIGKGRYLLAAHEAVATGEDSSGRHYEAVFYLHDPAKQSIKKIGTIATADMFPAGKTKDDTAVDLHDVVFTGGGYNGTFRYMTFGVRDGSIGFGALEKPLL